MREGVTLRCSECKNENYRKFRKKDNQNQIKLNLSKFCANCRKHTEHVEKKGK